jgi:hypothetical protein
MTVVPTPVRDEGLLPAPTPLERPVMAVSAMFMDLSGEVAARREVNLVRSVRELDSWLAEAFFGWRWMRYAYSPMRFLVPRAKAEELMQKRGAIEADGTEPMEPKYWELHVPYNNLPIVPHVTGSEVGAKRLLHTLNQMGLATLTRYRTKDVQYVCQIYREGDDGNHKLAHGESKFEDDAIVQSAVQLMTPGGSVPPGGFSPRIG